MVSNNNFNWVETTTTTPPPLPIEINIKLSGINLSKDQIDNIIKSFNDRDKDVLLQVKNKINELNYSVNGIHFWIFTWSILILLFVISFVIIYGTEYLS